MADQAAVDRILKDYPQFAFLINDPEVGPLLLQATDPNQPFDPQTFQAKLQQTTWFKSASLSQRQWAVTYNTDPATAAAQKDAWKAQVQQEALKAGIGISADQLENLAVFLVPTGASPNDPRTIAALNHLYWTDSSTWMAGGDISASGQDIQKAADQYMVDISPHDVNNWKWLIANGQADMQGVMSSLQQQAKERYGFYANQIDAGATPQQLFADKRQAIATQLEMDPTQIDLLHDPRWSKVLGVPDDKGGVRPMTASEAIVLARSQPEWQRTQGARTQGADLTQNLLKTFGAIA